MFLILQPGQYIKLNNLHAATFQSADTRPELSELPMVELVIHRGTTYGRGVHVISDDFDGIKTLKERLEKVSAEVRQKGVSVAPTHSMNNNARLNDSENCVENNTDISTSQPSINLSCYDGSQERNQSQEVAMEVSCDHVIQSQPQKSLKQVQIHQSVSQQSQSTARCMLQTSTGLYSIVFIRAIVGFSIDINDLRTIKYTMDYTAKCIKSCLMGLIPTLYQFLFL